MAGLIKKYPDEWVVCCHEIFSTYQNFLQETEGGKQGWKSIRDRMMVKEDKIHYHRFGEADTRLRRQDLENWIKRTGDDRAIIDRSKFYFIDRFLRERLIIPNSEFSFAVKKLLQHHEILQSSALKTLFKSRWNTPRDMPTNPLEISRGHLFVSELARRFLVSIYIKDTTKDFFRIVAFYHSPEFLTADQIIKNGYSFFGYLHPMSSNKFETTCILKLFDRRQSESFSSKNFNASQCKVRGDLSMTIEALSVPYYSNRNERDSLSPDISSPIATFPAKRLDLTWQEKVSLKPTELTLSQQDQLESLQERSMLW